MRAVEPRRPPISMRDRRHMTATGTALNAVVAMNPDGARQRRGLRRPPRRGATLGPLTTASRTPRKDSYLARGLTAAAGRRASLSSSRSATRSRSSACARRGGAAWASPTCRPMANGGMRRGVYGRAESLYNADVPDGARSARARRTARAPRRRRRFAAFGLGEETWSSGARRRRRTTRLLRVHASRGVISVRGNWPLVPTMDVVVPHTAHDGRPARGARRASSPTTPRRAATSGARSRGSGCRRLRRAARLVRRTQLPDCADGRAPRSRATASACRACTSNADPDAGTPNRRTPGIGGPDGPAHRDPRLRDRRCGTRPAATSKAAGAEVVEVDFPVVSNYEGDRAGRADHRDARSRARRSILRREIVDLSAVGVGRLPARPTATRRSPPLAARRRRARSSRPPRARSPTATPGFDDDIADVSPHGARRTPARRVADMPELEPACAGSRRPAASTSRSGWTRSALDAVGLPGGRRRRPRRHGRERPASADLGWRNGVVGRQRQPRAAAPRRPDGHGADGHDGATPGCRWA